MEVAIILLGVVVLVLLGGLFYVLRQQKDPSAQYENQAKLQVLTDHIHRLQTSMSEQLQTQEREISKKLEERLADVSQKVGLGLQENFKETQKNLSTLQERLAVIDTAQKNITQLSTQMVSLQDILASKDKRGVFGEVQLKDIVETVLAPNMFEFQTKLSNNTTPDCLIKLPNPPGPIVVDSKFPLSGYEQLIAAQNDHEKKAAVSVFKTSMKKHIKDISSKYIIPGETADSALMFLPSESVYAELYANYSDVVEEAFRAKVWIVSPTTLMATLNTVRAVVRDAKMQEQAGVILKEVMEISKDVTRLDTRVEDLQRHFDQASRDVEKIRTSTTKIVNRSERLDNLQLEEMEDDITKELSLQTPNPALSNKLTGT